MRPCAQQARLNGQRIPSSCEMARAADSQVRKAQHAGTLARLAPARARRILQAGKSGAPRQCAAGGARGYCAPSALTDARLTSGL